MVKSISGTSLTLKEPGTRGRTGTAGRQTQNEGMNASHLIADRFRGSGYKTAANLVATSSDYNQKDMKNVEDQIADLIVQTGDALGAEGTEINDFEFDMKVSVTWGTLEIANIVTEVVKKYPRLNAQELQKVSSDLTGFMGRVSKNLKRCMSVKYEVTIKAGQNSAVTVPFDLGPDVYLGTGLKG
jgi:hypothetical protein